MKKQKKISSLDMRGVSNKQGIKKILPQTGKRISMPRDAARSAQLPGKRVSKTGKVYWETRKNRSDAALKNI